MDRFLASSGYNTGGIDKIMPSIKHNEPTRIHREIGFVIDHIAEDTLFRSQNLMYFLFCYGSGYLKLRYSETRVIMKIDWKWHSK